MCAAMIVLGFAVALPFTTSAFAQSQGQGRGRGQQQQSQRQRPTIRFAEMDVNGNRIITREEWRGSERSFRVHDWDNDGVLSGDEVRINANRNRPLGEEDFGSPNQDYEFDDWTARGFADLDHNRDNRIRPDEWHFDLESFRRADYNNDGSLSRGEFLGTEGKDDDDRSDRFRDLDGNSDGRVTREEWHGAPARFDRLDQNKDGVLTRAEVAGTAPPELFTSMDVNRDGNIGRDEWHWSRASFEARDTDRDGRVSRAEFAGPGQQERSAAYRGGYERGMTEGRAAGREDRERNQGWDLEGQRELENADSGYESRVGPRPEYQAGYREGFRTGYREGFGR